MTEEIKRFMPCSVVRHIKTGRQFIVQYDYTYAYGAWNSGANFRDLSLFHLGEDGEITNCSAWHDADEFELVKYPMQEIFDKITRYEVKYHREISRPISA